jgi:hypothetical protein
MDWTELDLVVYSAGPGKAAGMVCLPSDNVLHHISLRGTGETYILENDPFRGKVNWKIRLYSK